MQHPFEQKLAQQWPVTDWADVTVLAAISGGPDSMALLRALLAVRCSGAASSGAGSPGTGSPGTGRLLVIHLNHGLRGPESDADEAFVRQEAERLHCQSIVEQVQNPTGTRGTSEDAARRARYDFFLRAAKEWGARYVLTAHTADDQAETILLRILRGTGLDGLSGIHFSRQLTHGVSLIRPLLQVSRFDVLDYLETIGQSYQHDSTNAESRFTRNRLRNELIPLLEREYNPRIKDALLRLGQMATDSQGVVAQSMRDLKQRCVEQTRPGRAALRCDALPGSSPYLVQQLMMEIWRDCGWGLGDMSWDHWRQLAGMALATAGSADVAEFPGKVRATRDDSLLVLESTARPLSQDLGVDSNG